ncbi:TPA: nucleoside deaminase [Candidatus Scatousia excrementigallinarum]|uniref:tRNA-specific adenosine deaminase n=1 Tax=Candidatus Scatousia excrementigallinarum TaxID=2840935 RepID=A0A9D1EX96_9BACT|nr:nucleoside deaminase [Candidatus Scatousia excrementigallinarum]
MERAIEAAKKASGEIAVGAVIVKDGKVISSSYNQKEALNDVTAHAEILAIREAEKKLGSWRLQDCEMYVTLEPCPMCAWAIVQSRIKTVYFGSYDTNYGALGSVIDVRKLANSALKVYGGIMEHDCDELLEKCFENLRK